MAVKDQLDRLARFKDERDQEKAERRLQELREACKGDKNLLPRIKEALRDHCSLGEVCGAMREEFGSYQPEM